MNSTTTMGFVAFSVVTMILEWILLTAIDNAKDAKNGKSKKFISKLIVFTFVAVCVALLVVSGMASIEYFRSGQPGEAVKLVITMLLILVSLYVLIIRKQIKKQK